MAHIFRRASLTSFPRMAGVCSLFARLAVAAPVAINVFTAHSLGGRTRGLPLLFPDYLNQFLSCFSSYESMDTLLGFDGFVHGHACRSRRLGFRQSPFPGEPARKCSLPLINQAVGITRGTPLAPVHWLLWHYDETLMKRQWGNKRDKMDMEYIH